MRPETLETRDRWDRMAAVYDRGIVPLERVLFTGDREWATSRARGDVLEIAVGTGRNLRHYPTDVRVTGIDLSPRTLAYARERAERHGLDVRLLEADAEDLPFDDATFDTVVVTLGLCSVPDDGAAVREATRVLRPGGRFIAVEHVASPSRAVRTVEAILDRLIADDEFLRDPLPLVRAAGLEVESLERRKLGIVQRLLARKPDVATRP